MGVKGVVSTLTLNGRSALFVDRPLRRTFLFANRNYFNTRRTEDFTHVLKKYFTPKLLFRTVKLIH